MQKVKSKEAKGGESTEGNEFKSLERPSITDALAEAEAARNAKAERAAERERQRERERSWSCCGCGC
jgi:hypothetical protein